MLRIVKLGISVGLLSLLAGACDADSISDNAESVPSTGGHSSGGRTNGGASSGGKAETTTGGRLNGGSGGGASTGATSSGGSSLVQPPQGGSGSSSGLGGITSGGGSSLGGSSAGGAAPSGGSATTTSGGNHAVGGTSSGGSGPTGNLTCLGNTPSVPTGSGDTVVTVMTAMGARIEGATVKVCALSDTTCAQPTATGTTDSEGKATVQVTHAAGGITGYFEISSPSLMTTLAYPRAASATTYDVTVITWSSSYMSQFAGYASSTLTSGKGHVVFWTKDCVDARLAGIQVGVSAADAGSKQFYMMAGGYPSASATATGPNALGSVVNVLPGATNVSGTIVATGQSLIPWNNVIVRADAMTMVDLIP